MKKIITLLVVLVLYAATAQAFDDGATYATARSEINTSTSKFVTLDAVPGIVKMDGAGTPSAAAAGTDYLAPDGDGSGLSGIARFTEGITAQTFTAADATPDICNGGASIVRRWKTYADTTTITNFDCPGGSLAAGDWFIMEGITAQIVDCTENANLECYAGNDHTYSSTQLEYVLWYHDGTRWVGPSVPMSSPTTLALSGIQSSTPVVGDPDSTTFTTTGTNLYGGKFIANAAGTYAHSGAIAVGENWAIEAQSAAAVAVTINAADTIMLNGTSCTQGVGLTSDSTVAAFVACQYQAASTITCRGASFTCTP